jgi:FkbH-like protein
MLFRLSRFIHRLPLSGGRALIVHAVSQVRLTADAELTAVIAYFDRPRALPGDLAGLLDQVPYTEDTLVNCLAALHEAGVITEKSPEEELAEASARLDETAGRDPADLLDQYRRSLKQGADAAWVTGAVKGLSDFVEPKGAAIEVLLFGDCDIQMEAEFLTRAGAERGLNLKVAATFPDDVRFAEERAHQAILIGALRSRHGLMVGDEASYIADARRLLDGLRARTSAPILIDNLPEPTVQPLGAADRGVDGHRNRFRRANLALEALAETYNDVQVVDIAAALNAVGGVRLLDDGLTGFTHFGSPGWMLQRPTSERAAVHDQFPDLAPLATLVDGDPYLREGVTARAHVEALMVALGLGRKKCVIVDLDGTLWPGVLAETGAPFAWSPEISGAHSYIGLYFGIHEALKALKRRGVVLACVSKNDEATVRSLWAYPDHYPKDRLLMPDDFVTWRVNWADKVENIAAIADELGFALDAFVFVDDNPVERERVIQRLPEVAVLGEDLFAVRRALLTDPRLQRPKVTEEAGQRTDLVKAQLQRNRLKGEGLSEADVIASLRLQVEITALDPAAHGERVVELFQRTTQFNTTGKTFSGAELARLALSPDADVFVMKVKDRFADHGLVAAAVVEGDEITALAMSCRVIGLGVEHRFLAHLLIHCGRRCAALQARIVETARNAPVRNLYADNSFVRDGAGVWRIALAASGRVVLA